MSLNGKRHQQNQSAQKITMNIVTIHPATLLIWWPDPLAEETLVAVGMASLNARELVVVNLEGVGVGGSVPTVPLPEAVGDAVNMLPSSDFSDALNEPVMPFILRTPDIRNSVRGRVLWTVVRECGRESLGGVGGVICVLQVERLEADEAVRMVRLTRDGRKAM